MMKFWLMTILCSTTVLSASSFQEEMWRARIEKALYAADRSEMVVLEDGSEAVSLEAIENLEATLTPMLAFSGDTPPESALEAARALAKYRRYYREMHDKPIRSWKPQKITFYLASPTRDGQHAHTLGWGSRTIGPGTPFANGDLLAFTRERCWYEDESGHLHESEITGLPVDTSRTLDAGEAYLAARADRESGVFNAIIDAMGPSAIYVGDPQPLEGEYYATSLKKMLVSLADERGAILKPGQEQVYVFDNKASMRSFKEQGGSDFLVKTVGELPTNAELKETVARAIEISTVGMDVYREVVDSYASKLVSNDEKVAQYAESLVDAIIEEYGDKEPDYKRMHGFLHKTLNWFEYEDNEQEALVAQRISNALRVIAEEGGVRGQRAAQLADILDEP